MRIIAINLWNNPVEYGYSTDSNNIKIQTLGIIQFEQLDRPCVMVELGYIDGFKQYISSLWKSITTELSSKDSFQIGVYCPSYWSDHDKQDFVEILQKNMSPHNIEIFTEHDIISSNNMSICENIINIIFKRTNKGCLLSFLLEYGPHPKPM